MKKLSNYNTSSKILDVKKGPLLGKYCQEYKGKVLRKEDEISKEI